MGGGGGRRVRGGDETVGIGRRRPAPQGAPLERRRDADVPKRVGARLVIVAGTARAAQRVGCGGAADGFGADGGACGVASRYVGSWMGRAGRPVPQSLGEGDADSLRQRTAPRVGRRWAAGVVGPAAGLAGATGTAGKMDLRPVVASLVVELPDGTRVWAERREGQSAWEAAGVFLEGLGEMSGAYSGHRARLAGQLGAEDWEEVVASVLVELPDGSRAWADRREGQTSWEAAGLFLERLGGRHGDLGDNRDSLARELEAGDTRDFVAQLRVDLPDSTKAWVMLREGQTSWEAAGAFLEGLGGGHGDLGPNRESLARQLEARDVRVAMVKVEMPDGSTRVAGIRAGQTAWEAAGAFLAGLGDTFGDLRHNRVALARRLDTADSRPVALRKWRRARGYQLHVQSRERWWLDLYWTRRY